MVLIRNTLSHLLKWTLLKTLKNPKLYFHFSTTSLTFHRTRPKKVFVLKEMSIKPLFWDWNCRENKLSKPFLMIFSKLELLSEIKSSLKKMVFQRLSRAPRWKVIKMRSSVYFALWQAHLNRTQQDRKNFYLLCSRSSELPRDRNPRCSSVN